MNLSPPASLRRRSPQGLLVMATLMLAGLFIAFSALAQDPPAEATETAPGPTERKTTLLQMIKNGGVTMFPLGLLSLGVVTLVARNFMTLSQEKLLRPDLVHQLEQHLAETDPHGALQICHANPCLMTTVLASGLNRITTDELDMESVQEGIEQAGRSQMTILIKPINYLSNIGAVAPMLGLLGTVSGMIKAFENISMGGMGKPEVLAANIGEALVTTASGLIIAIPAMMFYYYFKNNFADTMAQLTNYVGGMINTLRTGNPVVFDDIPEAEGHFVEDD